MRVFHDIAEIPFQNLGTAVAIGNFDGVHLGHQALLLRTIHMATERALIPFAMTFNPHPIEVLRPGSTIERLTTTSERLWIIENLGVPTILVQKFTHELANLSEPEFFQCFLVKGLNAKLILVGDDFKFGRGRKGNVDVLRELADMSQIELVVLPEVSFQNARISSTEIRKLITNCDLLQTRVLLGRPYFLSAIVIRGDNRGKSIGFPTANLSVSDEKLIPPHGVYVGRLLWKDSLYRSVLNIGVRPTFGNSSAPRSIEVHILDFDANIYGESVRLDILERIRPEQKFESTEELATQIRRDIEKARASTSF